MDYSTKYRENPTPINLINDSSIPLQEKLLRGGATLANLFAKPATSAMFYSPEAEAALLPATSRGVKLATRASRAGVTPDKLWRRTGLVNDGQGWNRHILDNIDETKLQQAVKDKNMSYKSLNDLMSHNSNDPRLQNLRNNTQYNFDPFLKYKDPNLLGELKTDGGVSRFSVDPNRDYESIKRTMMHEPQHVLDRTLGRSYGTNLAESGGDPFKYLHNMGETRARLNETLGLLSGGGSVPNKRLNPNTYEGIHDVFRPKAPEFGGESVFNRSDLWE